MQRSHLEKGMATSKSKKKSSNVSSGEVAGAHRSDLFKNFTPYYGSLDLYEVRDKIPTLFSLAVQVVLEDAMDYQSIPPTLQSKLNYCKEKSHYKGIKIMKCSVCSKYYSKQQKFSEHICI